MICAEVGLPRHNPWVRHQQGGDYQSLVIGRSAWAFDAPFEALVEMHTPLLYPITRGMLQTTTNEWSNTGI